MRLVLAALFSTAISSVCVAQQAPAPRQSPTVAPIVDASRWEGSIGDPVWLELPREEDFARLYPPQALAEGRSGRVDLYCRVTRDGHLLCAISGGSGFVDAMKALLPRYRMAPTRANGEPTAGAAVYLHVVWRHPNLPPGADVPFEVHPHPLPPSNVISNPVWLERPRAEDFVRHYPRAAMNADVRGRVILNCTVRGDGRLDCTIASEDPAGHGFGEASLALARRFRMATRSADGMSTEDRRIRIPINWTTGD